MNLRLIGIGSETIGDPVRAARALREMSPEQLLHLGVHEVAYVRAHIGESGLGFQLHGADGAPLGTVEALEDAVYMAAEQGFEFVTVH